MKEAFSFKFSFKELGITQELLGETMGYADLQSIPEPIITSFLEIMQLCENLSGIRGGYVLSEDFRIDSADKKVYCQGICLETNQIVTHQLRRSEIAACFVCTAGDELSEYASKSSNIGDLLVGYAADVMANIIVEQAMDKIQAQIESDFLKKGYKITNRYSPGYCDWNITEQKKLFLVFPENFLNISLTDSCLMIPTKSVSGIIGIGKSVHFNEYTCNLCKDINCTYRKTKSR